MVASTSLSRLRHCLNDVDYPADKDALLEAARRNSADEETTRALRAIPPETYANLTEVVSSVSLTDYEEATDRGSAVNPIVEELGENRGS